MYSYLGIVNDLLKEFPEISKNYAEEIAWVKDTFKSQETGGQTIYFDRCFCDYIGHLLADECQDNIKIEKVFSFLGDMAVSEDQEVRNLLQVTVLEYLRSWYLLQSRSEKLMLPETKKIFSHVKSYLQEPLREREPQLWKEPLKESGLTEKDLSDIEKGLGYKLPAPYREFLLSYKLPDDMTVLVSFCGDSFACSWSKTFSREKNGYIPRPEFDIGPTVEFEWHNIQGNSGEEFLKNLQQEQKTQDYCPCFLEAGFIGLGKVYGYLVYLDLVNGGVATIHEEGVYDMMGAGVEWNSKSEVRKYMEIRELYICKDFHDFLRFACTGDFLDEDEARFPTQEELEQNYSR